MKTILCYGDSNVWGTDPGVFDPESGLSGRLPKNVRWTGVLQNTLGEKYDVITEGISARTTNLDELVPGRPYKNGLALLPICLESHYPIDLVILWLGTNDVKIQFNRSPKQITEGLRELVVTIKTSNKGLQANSPKILIVAPQPGLKLLTSSPQIDEAAIKKTHELAQHYKKLAQQEQCDFLDASEYVSSSTIDGIHLDRKASGVIGEAIAEKVKDIFIE